MARFEDCEAYNAIKWSSHGTSCQRCQYNYNGTIVTEDVRFPYNPFKKTLLWFTIDIMLPQESKQIIETNGGEAIDSETYYCPVGYWFAQFNDADKLVNFIDNILPTIQRYEIA